jgi:hypothetical protein
MKALSRKTSRKKPAKPADVSGISQAAWCGAVAAEAEKLEQSDPTIRRAQVPCDQTADDEDETWRRAGGCEEPDGK